MRTRTIQSELLQLATEFPVVPIAALWADVKFNFTSALDPRTPGRKPDGPRRTGRSRRFLSELRGDLSGARREPNGVRLDNSRRECPPYGQIEP